MVDLKKCCKFHGNIDMHEVDVGYQNENQVVLHMICNKCGTEWVE
jgi:hypothetical protein